MRNGDKSRQSYVVKEWNTDWDGNKIAVLGRFEVGDAVVVSKAYRERIKERYPDVCKKLSGIKKIDSIVPQLTMVNVPRYWTGGLAHYTVEGCSFIISDEDLKLASDKDRTAELNMQINSVLHDMFPTYSMEIGMEIRDDVIEDVKTASEWPNYNGSDVSLAIQRALLRRMGVSV